MTTSEQAVIWQQRKQLEAAFLDAADEDDNDDDIDDDANQDEDIPPEVPKRTSSKGVGSVPLASSTSASGRSSAGSMSIRGQVKSVGNGVANNESRQPRICSATGRPLVEWSSESTLGASERVRRHRMHHLHHHHYYHHHHHAASYPRYPPQSGRGGSVLGPSAGTLPVPGEAPMVAKKKSAMRQVASADEASDSEDIDVCETCSEWLSKALLCSCQIPSSASSSPSQGQLQSLEAGFTAATAKHQPPRISSYQQQRHHHHHQQQPQSSSRTTTLRL